MCLEQTMECELTLSFRSKPQCLEYLEITKGSKMEANSDPKKHFTLAIKGLLVEIMLGNATEVSSVSKKIPEPVFTAPL